jgi:predicted ATPase
MQEGWAAIQTTGVRLNRVYFLARLAEVLMQAGKPDAGLTVLAEALTFIHTTGERWWEAECHRLWGECLRAQQEPTPEAGEVVARYSLAMRVR